MDVAVTAAMAGPNPKVAPSCRLVVVTRQKVGKAKKKHPFDEVDGSLPSHACAVGRPAQCHWPCKPNLRAVISR